MATIKQLDDVVSKTTIQKDQLTLKANQIEAKIANLRKSLVNASNNPTQADNIKKQITTLQAQKRTLTGVDFDVNETVEMVEEDGESISTGSYAGAEFAMPITWKKGDPKNIEPPKKKQESLKVPLLARRDNVSQMNKYIDNLGGK